MFVLTSWQDHITFRPFERTITLQKDSTGHVGFVFKDNEITAIVKDSSAARNGVLIDHHLLEVDGQNVVGLKVSYIPTKFSLKNFEETPLKMIFRKSRLKRFSIVHQTQWPSRWSPLHCTSTSSRGTIVVTDAKTRLHTWLVRLWRHEMKSSSRDAIITWLHSNFFAAMHSCCCCFSLGSSLLKSMDHSIPDLWKETTSWTSNFLSDFALFNLFQDLTQSYKHSCIQT